MKTLVLETPSPSQGLAEPVTHDQGPFERCGLAIEWAVAAGASQHRRGRQAHIAAE